MTTAQQARPPADTTQTIRNAPVIVMAYTGSGADQLRSQLSAFPGLTCTAGTGILPACHQAAAAWHAADSTAGGVLSPLATKTITTVVTALTAAVLARGGGSRWCEFTTAPPPAADTFARLYPQTRFLTVHRRADSTIRAILDASPWGLTGPVFAPFTSASPVSTLTALAAYWAAYTTQQLAFERAHPRTCHRVRIEDIQADTSQTIADITAFLTLDTTLTPPPLLPGSNGHHPATGIPHTNPAQIPLDQIPAPLKNQLNDLHDTLGYPPLTPASTRQQRSLVSAADGDIGAELAQG
jgi:Sulfotransferase family